ncbi:unnamed protein product, partial [Discosporangium mesarthrocarpum]
MTRFRIKSATISRASPPKLVVLLLLLLILVCVFFAEMVVVHFQTLDPHPFTATVQTLGWREGVIPSYLDQDDIRAPLLRGSRSMQRRDETTDKESAARESVGIPVESGIQKEFEESTGSAYDGLRVAVVIPYIGGQLPAWFDSFAELAAASSDFVDWIIFCAEDLANISTPPNVVMVPMSPTELAWQLSGIVYPPDADQKPEMYPAHMPNNNSSPVEAGDLGRG